MLSKERLRAIRQKVNTTDDKISKNKNTISSVSFNGQRITDRKKESFKTANGFIIRGKIEDDSLLIKRGERSLNCAQQRYIVTVNGKAHTVFTHRCRSRHCQNCQRIKAFVWQEKMKEIFPDLIANYPNHKYLFITFTVKNPKIKNLRLVLLCMTRAYAKMFQRKAFKKWFVGDIRSTEITRGKSGSDEAHPHFHALICVHPTYFKGVNYMSADVWGKNWGECLAAEFKKENIEYNTSDYPKGFPRVDIRLAKSADRKTDITNKNISEHGEQLINYVLKYSVKGSDLLKDGKADDWFFEFDKQVKSIRMIAASGDIKKSLSALERDQFDYSKEQEKIEKMIVDDAGFKADKAIFKKEGHDYDYYLESKKDRYQYIIEAIDCKAYNYQMYYKRLLVEHREFYREGLLCVCSNIMKYAYEKEVDGDFYSLDEKLEMLLKEQSELIKIQVERLERLKFFSDAMVRVGGYRKVAENVYYDIHRKEKVFITKSNIVDVYKDIETELTESSKINIARLSTIEKQEQFDALVKKINYKSKCIDAIRKALCGAGAYVYNGFEYYDTETNEALQCFPEIE